MANVFETAKSVNLKDVIERYGKCTLSKRATLSSLSCPICGHNGCFSLFINNKTGELNYKCFSCGKFGDGISFVKELHGFATMYDAAKQICDDFCLVYDENTTVQVDPHYKEYMKVFDYAAGLFNVLYNSNMNCEKYFEMRGLSPELISEYKLGYLPEVIIGKNNNVINLRKDVFESKFSSDVLDDTKLFDKNGNCVFAGRYIFPITNSKGKVISFAGRSLKDGVAKYINSSETNYFKKQQTLFNYHKAIKYPSVIVVEGYMDALSLIQAGIPNVVAAMGTAFCDGHLDMLKGKEIILALDNDGPGLSHMYDFIIKHRDMFIKVIKLKGYKDFNEALMNGADLKALVSKTIDGPEFVIRYLSHTLDLSLVESRRTLWLVVAQLLGSDRDNVYRAQFPLNTLYTPFDHSYYWTKCIRLVKGNKTKGGE